MKINSIIDTGSSITVIHPKKYYEIDRCMRPKLEPNYSNLRMANGDLVVPEGQTVLQFKIKGEIIEHRTIVADIDAQMILGFDFQRT